MSGSEKKKIQDWINCLGPYMFPEYWMTVNVRKVYSIALCTYPHMLRHGDPHRYCVIKWLLKSLQIFWLYHIFDCCLQIQTVADVWFWECYSSNWAHRSKDNLRSRETQIWKRWDPWTLLTRKADCGSQSWGACKEQWLTNEKWRLHNCTSSTGEVKQWYRNILIANICI